MMGTTFHILKSLEHLSLENSKAFLLALVTTG